MHFRTKSTAKFQSAKRDRKGYYRTAFEQLEGRALLAVLVSEALSGNTNTLLSGTVYEDLNSDGIKNNGEDGKSGWSVYLDLDNSGTRNTDAVGELEPITTTNIDGEYSFNRLKPGTYRVGEIVQANWRATSAVQVDTVVQLNQETKNNNFFVFLGGAIQGTAWHDVDEDGVRDKDPVTNELIEPGLAGWTIFLDVNKNELQEPTEPKTVTDENGYFEFTDLPPDDYEVYEVLPGDWEITHTYDFRQTAAVTAGGTFVMDYGNFNNQSGSIHGTVWNDANGNGDRDLDPITGEFTEPGLEGWTIFLDDNENDLLDAGEPSTITDANGVYHFLSLTAKNYTIAEVLLSSWAVAPFFSSSQTVTVVAGESINNLDFANFTVLNGSISGTVWNDLNRNGSRDFNSLTGAIIDTGIANWSVYLDLNRNGVWDTTEPKTLTDVNGDYLFSDLQIGDYKVKEVVPTGWEIAPLFNDGYTVTVFSGSNSVAHDFANYNLSVTVPGTISGVVWNDLNSNGIRDTNPSTGLPETGLAGWVVFVDANADGLFTAGETQVTTASDGSYTLSNIQPGTVTIVLVSQTGWRATAPLTNSRSIVLRSGDNLTNQSFGQAELRESSISGVIFFDKNLNGTRETDERGLSGITVYLDQNNNQLLDLGEPQIVSSSDLFYTPATDESGNYSFSHLATGSYQVRIVLPDELSATPIAQLQKPVSIPTNQSITGVNFAAVYRDNEINGLYFDDVNGNKVKDLDEPGLGGVTIYVDSNRNNQLDIGEDSTVSLIDGTYSLKHLKPGNHVVRGIPTPGRIPTSPATVGGTLWPPGTSNAAVGIVSPSSITTVLNQGETYRQMVSLTLPNTGALTNLVDVFLLFDDTGSFVNNSPIVRAAFPDIIAQLNSSLSGINLGFGVGRLEEYANFASEYAAGRPFVLNQPIVAASNPSYLAAIQAALNRTTPGYGGDQPETDIEALYQLVTGKGFDGNNNGTTTDSGAAGLASTQINPGISGDVPAFSSFTPDLANNVLPAAGTIGGAGFRAGALPIILLATDTGFAYQPKGETVVTGLGGVSVPVSQLTQTSRNTTPFSSGAGLQETITALNALGALVIGLGTNPGSGLDPRQGLEAISKLTGATNQSAITINNGTTDTVAPGDPFYFQIASGFGTSVANGVINAIQNAVTRVAVDVTVKASDPRVKIINHTGSLSSIGAGETATFDIEIVGDGAPRRFDLQFVRAGTNVILGSIPVVLGTNVPGDCYEYDELEDGQIKHSSSLASRLIAIDTTNTDLVSGTLSLTARTGVSNNYSVTANATTISISDSGESLVLSSALIAAGWTGSGTNTITGPVTGITSLVINSGDGTDMVNLGAWSGANLSINGGGQTGDVLNLNDAIALANGTLDVTGFESITQASTAAIDLGTTGTLNAIAANGITLAANISAGNSTLNPGVGNIVIAGPVTVTGNWTLAGSRNVTVNASQSLTAPHLRTNNLSLASGTLATPTTVTVAMNGGSASLSSIDGTLSIGANSRWNLNDNDAILRTSNASAAQATLTSVATLISSGSNGGTWTGMGITSLAAATSVSGLATLGFANNAELGLTSFNGQTIDTNAVLIKYTYFGDSNLDGFVTDDDLGYFLAGYGTAIGNNPWSLGDYNHDGFTTDDDLGYFLASYASTPGLASDVQPLSLLPLPQAANQSNSGSNVFADENDFWNDTSTNDKDTFSWAAASWYQNSTTSDAKKKVPLN
jgi:hypothetical protein